MDGRLLGDWIRDCFHRCVHATWEDAPHRRVDGEAREGVWRAGLARLVDARAAGQVPHLRRRQAET